MYRSFLTACLLSVLITDAALAETITLNLPKLEAEVGDQISVPVSVQGAKQMVAWQLVLVHDPAMLKVVEAGPGQLLEGANALLESNSDNEGRTWIASASIQPLAEDGDLVRVTYEVVGNPGEQSVLTIEKAEAWQANETEILIETEAGSVAIGEGGSLLWLIAALLAAIVTSIGAILFYRRRSKAVKKSMAQKPDLAQPPVQREPQVAVTQPAAFKIQIDCPNCQKSLFAPSNASGKTGRCSGCGEQLVIPELTNLAALAG